MKKNLILIFTLFGSTLVAAQTNKLDWSSFDMGYSSANGSAGAMLQTVVGQSVVGVLESPAGVQISNGFLAGTIYSSTNTFGIMSLVVGHGTMSPMGWIKVSRGAQQTFTFSPDSGWHMDSLLIDGQRSDSIASYTFSNITSSHSITAYFTPNGHFVMFDVNRSWNMVSVPVRCADNRKRVVFPSAISSAFSYKGTYVTKETLSIGTGYWLKFRTAEPLYIIGPSIVTDTIDVTTGWNLIGSISTPVAVDNILSVPPAMITSDVYGYASRYKVAETINPGQAYWIKVLNDGKLILDSSRTIMEAGSQIKRLLEDTPPEPPEIELQNSEVNLPSQFVLEQNYPNPFNPTTAIRYQLPVSSRVTLRVHNLLGQVVATLADGVQEPGTKIERWDASSLASGIYFYRLEATSISDPRKNFSQVRKMLLMK